MKEDKVGKYIENNKMIDLDEEIEDIKEEWKQFFKDHKKAIEEIFENIGTSYYFPKREDVFRVFKKGKGPSLKKLKCVVVGMDPYYSYNIDDGKIVPDATGRSFEVAEKTEWKNLNKSLENILKALYFNKYEEKESLEKIRKNDKFVVSSSPQVWFNNTEKRGVLWLNAALTVEPYRPGSHVDLWAEFMSYLVKYVNKKNPQIMWILCGDVAQALFDTIDEIPKERRVETVHPASRKTGKDSFIDNNFLKKELSGIDWEC